MAKITDYKSLVVTTQDLRAKYSQWADIFNDFRCPEAYVMNGELYYRWDAEYPVTEPGQITFNILAPGETEPKPCTATEFHEAQKHEKLV